MSYLYYDEGGRPCGYTVRAICDAPGCKAEIWRGFREKCDGELGCGRFFCSAHLGELGCSDCADLYRAAGEGDGHE